ncbi:hypothetical protein FALBO_5685 [Fusarium albosuccineum]|uniref:Uncharacterized protein n=1 Tax=Fusarium albosuccineum TaxID=1237068 RepID=A0A8H4PE17_9HYPO|nr:hypothetical protein FALBO_5685 [Fusarium albosuccineum]
MSFPSLPFELRLMIFEFWAAGKPSIQAFDVVPNRTDTPGSPAKLVLSSHSDASIWKPATDPSTLMTLDIAAAFGAKLTSDEWLLITAYESPVASEPTEFLIRRNEDVVYLFYDQANYELMSRPLPWHRVGEQPHTTSHHGPKRVALHPTDVYHGIGLNKPPTRPRLCPMVIREQFQNPITVWLDSFLKGLVAAGVSDLYFLGPASYRRNAERVTRPRRRRGLARSKPEDAFKPEIFLGASGRFVTHKDWHVSEAWATQQRDGILDGDGRCRMEEVVQPMTLHRLTLEDAKEELKTGALVPAWGEM